MNRPQKLASRLLSFSVGLVLAFAPLRLSAETFYGAWEQVYNAAATSSQTAHAVALDRRGNVFVTGEYFTGNGNDTNLYTAKYDGLDGHLVWQKFESLAAGNSFLPNAIAADANGDCVVTGNRNAAGSIDYFTIKYSGVNGSPMWAAPKIYNGPNDGEDTATKVAFDSVGNVVVTGKSVGKNAASNSTGFDFATIKYNGVTGVQIGAVDRYSATTTNLDDIPTSLVIDSNDNIIIAGTAVTAPGQNRLYVRKLNSALGLLWGIVPIETGAGSEDIGGRVAVDSANNVVVTGLYQTNNQFGYYTAKLAGSNGAMIWDSGTNSPVSDDTFGSPRPGPAGVAIGPDDQPIVTGTLLNQSGTRYIRTIKYSSGGFFGGALPVWSTASVDTGLGFGDTSAHAVVTDGSSNTIIVGETVNTNADSDIYVAKYDGVTGERNFAGTYAGSQGTTDVGVDVATDGFGNITALGTAFLAKQAGGLTAIATFKFNRFIATVGDTLPDGFAGVADAAVYSAGNPPALSDNNSIVTKATVASGRKRTSVILAQGAGGGNTFPGVQGQVAPAADGNVTPTDPKFASFSDPIIAPDGTYAFAAKTTGSAAHANGLWTNMSGTLKRVLRQGDPIPGLTPAANLASVMSYSMRNNELVALVKVSGPASMNTVLLRVNQNSTIFPLLRTGISTFQLNTGYTVKSLATLSPAKASPGDGRWEGNSAVMVKAVAVQTSDKKNPRDVLLRVAVDGSAVAPLVYSTKTATGVDSSQPTATYKSFGLPSIGGTGLRYAFIGVLNPMPGQNDISGANDSFLVYSDFGSTFSSFGREGVATGVSGISTLPYAAFTDPITNNNGDVAFTATLKGVSGTKVTAANNKVLLFGTPTPGGLNKVIRLGDVAAAPTPIPPETAEADTKYSSIVAYALSGGPDGAPIFVAKLSGAATSKTNMGLFAVGSNGAVRRLLRTGDHLGDDTIKTISLLKTIPKAFGTARSFNSTGSVVVALTFTNHKTALLGVGIP